jgi:hypothetical protein
MADKKKPTFEWKITNLSRLRIFDNQNQKKAFHYFRASSSAFIQKREVKEYILKRDNYTCVNCGSKDNLQIDHILSVWHCFNRFKIMQCNKIDNLQTLCRKCNLNKPL